MKVKELIGRQEEKQIIFNALNSKKSELGILYGRRRVGKSFLLQSIEFKQSYFFEAVKNYSVEKQVAHFLKQFSEQEKLPILKGSTWEEAFDIITPYFIKKSNYVVFDEFPWMASERTELVSLLKYYWDNKWSKNPNLTLILCGSIANFMVKHILHSQALHNRKTFEIKLKALPCNEAKDFFPEKYSLYEKTLFLMTVGGIPKYLEQMNTKISFYDNITNNFFKQNGFFVNEFETIFKEQFKKYNTYTDIVYLLSKNKMSQSELSKVIHLSGGGFKEYLDTLENADFITHFRSLDFKGKEKKKTIKYNISDEFLHFYFYFIYPNKKKIEQGLGEEVFKALQGRKLDAFMGIAFERFCQKNIKKIIQLLNIHPENIINFGPYHSQKHRSKNEKSPMAQVDLMIVLKKNRLLIIECKFTNQPLGMYIIQEIQEKINRLCIPKSFSISPVLISASGVIKNVMEQNYFDSVITIEHLLA
jgi:AAA+ ATPase superfamily predicted ATPase